MGAVKDSFKLYLWLDRYAYRCDPRQWWSTATLYLVSSILEVLTLGSLILAVQAIDPDQSTGYNLVDSVMGEGTRALVTAVVVLFFALTATAGCVYLTAQAVRKLGRTVTHRQAQDLLDGFAGSEDLTSLVVVADKGAMAQVVNSDAKMSGLALLTTFTLVKALVLSLVYSWALIQINLWATIVLVPVGALAGPIALKMARQIQVASRNFFMTSSQAYGAEVLTLLNQADEVAAIDSDAKVVSVGRLEGAAVEMFYDEYDIVLLANDRTNFVTSMLQSIALVVALGVVGVQALDGSVPFYTVLIYIISVQRAAANARNLAAHLTNLVRYQPMVRRAREFMETLAGLSPAPPIQGPSTLSTVADGPLLIDNSTGLGRFEIARLRSALTAASYPHNAESLMFVGPTPIVESASLAELALPASASPRLSDLLNELSVGSVLHSSLLNHFSILESTDSMPQFNELPAELRLLILFSRCRQVGASGIVLSAKHTDEVSADAWAELQAYGQGLPIAVLTEGRSAVNHLFSHVAQLYSINDFRLVPFDQWEPLVPAGSVVGNIEDQIMLDIL